MTRIIKIFRSHYYLILILIGIVYLATRLINLTLLPVFSDEAIYVRWAQLINQDFSRYVFFPLQDGKTPLHMILLSRLLPIYRYDPLLITRIMSVMFGLANLYLIGYLTKIIGGRKFAIILSMTLYTLVPYSLIHDRLGLIDVMLFTGLCLTTIFFIKVTQKSSYIWVILSGLALGLSLWIKLPAIFYSLVIFSIYLIKVYEDSKSWKLHLIKFAIGGILGIGIFGLLKISPSFPALFTRGNDFSFSPDQIVSGQLDHMLGNLYKLVKWLFFYITIPLTLVLALSIWKIPTKKQANNYGLWALAGLTFVIPIMIFGKVVYPRYLLPILILILPAITMQLVELVDSGRTKLVTFLIIFSIIQAVGFNGLLIFKPEMTPFPIEDKVQYLREWSAGYGIPEVRDFIRYEAQESRIVVATEGYFGTLPDGLLMYFDESPLIENIEIFGIGQPIRSIPTDLFDKAKTSDTYLLVNEDRYLIDNDDDCCEVVKTFPRPFDGPAAMLIKIKSLQQ